MRLLDALVQADGDGATARLRVDPEAWYAAPDGTMPAWFGLEVLAQTIAAWSGSRSSRPDRPPRVGYLLGTRSYTCQVPAFPAGSLLEAQVRPLFEGEGGLGAHACTLILDGAEVASAQLKVFEAP